MKRDRKTLIRVIVASVIFFAALVAFHLPSLRSFAEAGEGWHFADYRFYVVIVPYLVAYLIAGYDVVLKAGRNLVSGRLLDENFLMVVATFGAIALLDLPEACGVMLFYQVGELFQRYAVGKSRRSISSLMNIRPDVARVLRDGEEVLLSPEEVLVGDVLVVRAGERIPVDGVVLDGEGSLDVSSLTGESLPRSFAAGDEVLSGSINLAGEFRVRALKAFTDSTVAKILDLVENAAARKAKTENFITKFARYYTPVVVGAALLIGVLPPLILGGGWGEWIKKALTFLVVSCPCALVISVPLSFFGGIGGASKKGILIKGGGAMERLAEADTFFFDKTGTLTRGSFEVTGVSPAERSEEILAAAAIAESGSNHPIARSVVAYAPVADRAGYEIKEVSGKGVRAEKGEDVILVGNARFLSEEGVDFSAEEDAATVLYVARKGEYLGKIVLADLPKENAAEVLRSLREKGCRTVMLTGDHDATAKVIADRIGVDEYAADLLPQQKVERLESELARKERKGVCFVGDGINDAPVLAMADVGISMGGIGSDAAIEASDVVLMHDDLAAVPEAKRISRRTMRIARENIGFALGVKVAVLLLTALGLTGAFAMWIAVFADVGVAALAILNAMRTLR